MDTTELLRCLRSDDVVRQTFGGVLPRDKLPKRRIKTFPITFIVNTDRSHEPGRHWVAIHLDSKHYGELFDSYGNAPASLGREFETFLEKNVEGYSYNDKRLQGDYSTTCGQFCLFYLHHRCRGHDTREIVRMFHKDPEINDILVNDFINEKYDGNFDVFDVEFLVNQIARPRLEARGI